LFLDSLQTAFERGDLAPLREPAAFAKHLAPLRRVNWVVYAKRPFGGANQVLDYLGRYTHRVAIANERLLDCENGSVRFRWKDYHPRNKSKAMTLDASEFMRRFLLHVLPKGFRRIRYFGFLANACRTGKLPRIRAALDAPEPQPAAEPADYRERYAMLTGQRIDLCPCCGGRMINAGPWPRRSTPNATM
jgi:Putative transposase